MVEERDGPARRWQRVTVVLLVAVVLPTTLVLLVVWQSPQFSVFDEPAHSDYLRRIERGELPRVGDTLLHETANDIQCRTVQGRTNAPCGLPSYDTEILDARGFQYEAQQPPLYYMITAGLRQVARIGPADSFVTSARLTGAVWLSAGLLVFVAACRRLRCPWWPTMTVTALLAISPTVIYQSSTINNDATAILTGSSALLMFAVLRESTDRRTVGLWSLVAFLLVLIKPTALLAIGAAVVGLGVDAAVRRRLDRSQALSFAAPAVAAGVGYFGWNAIRDARATIDFVVVKEALAGFKRVEEFPLGEFVANMTQMLRSYASGGFPIAPGYVVQPATVAMFGLVAAGTVALWERRGGDAAQRMGCVALAALLATGPVFTVQFYLDFSVGGGPPSRYGLVLLPLLGVAAASTYRTRRAVGVLAGLGLLILVALVAGIFAAGA